MQSLLFFETTIHQWYINVSNGYYSYGFFFIQTLEELRRKLAVIDNELNKEKGMSRRYQVAVERLMQFVEVKQLNNSYI